MLSEDDLTRLLGLAAQEYDVPGYALEEPPTAPPRRWQRRGLLVGTAAAALVAVALLVQAFGGAGSPGRSQVASTPAVATAPAPYAPQVDQGPVVRAPAPALGPVGAPAAAGTGAPAAGAGDQGVADGGGARVVKTATVTLLADRGRVGAVLDGLQRLVVAPAYVASQSAQPIGTDPSATLTMRVPVGTFQDVVRKVQQLGAKVVSVESSGRDVTAAYADTEAQIASLKAARGRYLTILSGARTIGEILTVQQRVDDVQGQIDRLEGQRRVLANQSDLATITVSVSEKPPSDVKVAKPRTGLALAWDRAQHGFSSGVEGLVAHSGRGLLVLLVGLVLLALGRLGWRLARRRLL